MRIIYNRTVTDEDVREEIEAAISEAITEKAIRFPDETARSEFTADCVGCTVMDFEDHDASGELFDPDYIEIVYDMAHLYGYIVED